MKQLYDSTKALARAVDPAPGPGDEPQSLESSLLEAGVPARSLASVRRIIAEESTAKGAEFVRRLLRSLPNSREGRALARAIQVACLGEDGRSLADHAVDVGVSPQRLQVSAELIHSKLTQDR